MVVFGLFFALCSLHFALYCLVRGADQRLLDNSEIVIIQSPFTGKVSIYTTPGPVAQNFGTATHYKKSNQFWFSNKHGENDKEGSESRSNDADNSIKIRFNDGGHGNISGSVRWYMPPDEKAILKLHTDFGSQRAIEQQLIRQRQQDVGAAKAVQLAHDVRPRLCAQQQQLEAGVARGS